MTLLEIYPPACLLVVGPQVAIATENTTGSSSNGNGFPYSYRATVEAGMRAAVEALPPDASEEEKKGQQRLLRDAYNLDPTLAAHKVTEILKECGCYADWMKKTFAEHVTATSESQPNATLQHLLNLQGNGALLACTQYDTCLDSAAGTNPVLMGEEEMFQKWVDGEVAGFLHLHGVFSKPSTVQLDGVNYVNYLSESNPTGYNTLREIFRKRTVIFVGYDSNYFNPLILTFLKVVYSDDSVLRNPPILLACDVPCPLEALSSFLLFKVSKEELLRLEDTLSPGSEKNFAIGKGLEKPSEGLKVQAFLLFEEKQSFRKLGDIIYQQNKSGEIYVRRDALTVIYGEHLLYGNLVTYGRSGLRQLWNLVFARDSPLQGKGLLALGLLNAAIVWPRKKPNRLGCVTGINSVHAYAMTKPLPSIPPLVRSKPSLAPPPTNSSLTSKGSCEITTTSSESVHPPIYPISVFTALNPLGQPLQVVQGNSNIVVAGNQLASSPTTRLASVKPQTNSYDLNTHLQMISQLHNQPASTMLPQQDGQLLIAPQPPKYCLALPPEVLSTIPPYLIRFQNQLTVAERTIESIDQLVTPWSSVCNSSNEQQSSKNTSSRKSEPAAEVGLMSAKRSSKANVESFQVGEIPSVFQRVATPQTKKHSASEASQQSSPENSHVASRFKPLVSSPTQLQLIPSPQTTTSPLAPSKDLRLPPQVLMSPTTVVPQFYPPCMVLNQQPLSYCMVVSPPHATAAHPMLVMNPPTAVPVPQTPSLSSPTGQPVIYLLPDGRCVPAMPLVSAQPSAVSSIQATTSSSPALESGKTQAKKRPSPPSNSDSPTLPRPPLKRRKRSNSLPNILQPLSKDSSRNTKQGEGSSAILKTLPTGRAKDSSHGTPKVESLLQREERCEQSSHSTPKVESLLQREERCEQREQRTGTTSGSDTETASSEVDEAEGATALTPTTANKANIQLWEFLLELLLTPDHGSIIQWTGSSYEFCIVNPEAVANLWGTHRNKPRMTYEKLSRALRYYYSKGIMEKVQGKRLTYKFLFDIQKYVSRNQARTISIS